MKSLTTLLFLFTVAIIICCQQPQKSDDPEVLKKILTDYFAGIKNKDVAKMNSVTTPDFILFEDGKVWNNDSLINFLNTFKSFQGNWTFKYMKVSIDALSGNMIYQNHGDFVMNDTTKVQLDWIESATFRKVDGSWKMNFLHSTVRK